MTTAAEWVIEQRAKYLAIVHFTRRNDLVVECREGGLGELGLDLLVRILKDEHETGRIFGVKVVQCSASKIRVEASGVELSIELPDIAAGIPFPIVLVAFNLETDEGYYTYYSMSMPPKSRRSNEIVPGNLQPLNRETLDRIFREVNDWYEKQHLRND